MTKLQIFMYQAKLYCILCKIVLLVKASQTDIGQVVQHPIKTGIKLCKIKENTTQLDSLSTCKSVEKRLFIFIADDINNASNQLYDILQKKDLCFVSNIICLVSWKPLKPNEESKLNLKLKRNFHFQPKSLIIVFGLFVNIKMTITIPILVLCWVVVQQNQFRTTDLAC